MKPEQVLEAVTTEWLKSGQIRLRLPDHGWAKISLQAIARQLRKLADSGQIEREYNALGSPLYRKRSPR